MSAIVRKATRIGGKNKFALVGLALAGYLLLSKKGQTTAASGIPLVTSAGQAVGETIESLIPLDIFGRELKTFGQGFGSFGQGIGTGIQGIFSPITSFINWASGLVGLGAQSTAGGQGGNPSAEGNAGSPQAQEEEMIL